MPPRKPVYGKPDSAQAAIVEGLRELGASVAITTAVGGGFPDVVVGHQGRTYVFEIKPKGGKLTLWQKEYHASWRGTIYVIESLEDALAVMGIEAQ